MDIYAQIAEKIIAHQEQIIGPVAVEQAEQVPNIQVNWAAHQISITGNGSNAIDNLVEQYKRLFGQISVEVSKEAAGSLLGQLSGDQLPKTLA